MDSYTILVFTYRFLGNDQPLLSSFLFEEYVALSKSYKLIVMADEISSKLIPNIKQVKVSNSQFPFFKKLFKIISYCVATLKYSRQYQIIYLRYLHNQFTIPSILAKLFLRKKLVIWISSSVETRNTKEMRFQRPFAKLALHLADIIGTTSEHVVIDVENNIGKINRPKKYFSSGVNLSILKPLSISKENLLLTVCRIVPIKGLENLINSIPFVKERFPDVKLKIIGPGHNSKYGKSLKKIIKNLKCEDNIEFVGPVPNNEILSYYQTPKIFILSSISEGQPAVIMEAMACGLPIIATSVGSIPNMIDNGITGYLLSRNNPEFISEKIISILSNDELRIKMSNASRKKAEEEYNIEEYFLNLKNLINQALTM
jgi:glycosyltransferase involved in cell wall biosynthesis